MTFAIVYCLFTNKNYSKFDRNGVHKQVRKAIRVLDEKLNGIKTKEHARVWRVARVHQCMFLFFPKCL
jgi:hypothetical protein